MKNLGLIFSIFLLSFASKTNAQGLEHSISIQTTYLQRFTNDLPVPAISLFSNYALNYKVQYKKLALELSLAAGYINYDNIYSKYDLLEDPINKSMRYYHATPSLRLHYDVYRDSKFHLTAFAGPSLLLFNDDIITEYDNETETNSKGQKEYRQSYIIEDINGINFGLTVGYNFNYQLTSIISINQSSYFNYYPTAFPKQQKKMVYSLGVGFKLN